MKLILVLSIFIFSFIIFNCFAQQYGWIDISGNIPPFPYDTTIINGGQDTIIAGLTDLFFIDDNEGWITTYHPFNDTAAILHTTDGGTTFSIQKTILPTHALHMVSATEGYCGGQSGFVYKTTDGGISWPFLGTITNTLIDITFPPSGTTGYACGLNGTIYSVTSGGVTVMTSGVNGDLSSLTFPVSSTEGWVCGGGSVIRHFTGGTWVADQTNITGNWNGIYFVDNQNGWVVGDRIKRTTDGKNWTTQINPDTQNRTLIDVFFLNANEGWIVGNQGLILHTTNGGTTWNIEGNGLTSFLLTGVYFTSSNNGYVVGNGKTLLKYTQLTSLEDEETQPTEFKLEQNYPNPFNPATNIGFRISDGGFISLKVYDVLGKEVATLVDEYKSAGSYEVEFNVGQDSSPEIASGIYFYKLTAGNYIETKKMILTK